MLNNKMHFFNVLFLLYFFLPTNSLADHSEPTVISLSASLNTLSQPQGSLMGGTMLYIKGTNFNTNPSLNQVFIGPYPCQLLAEGSNQNHLACRTTVAFDKEQVDRLGVKIEVGEKKKTVLCSSNNCLFSYKETQTPMIEQIYPRTAIGREEVSIFGKHRISDPGDGRSVGSGEIVYFLIGDTLCSIIDTDQEIQLSPDHRDRIFCNVYLHQEAGQYDFVELVKPGYARKSIRTQQTSFYTLNTYTQRVTAKISSMFTHEGGNFGQKLRITGTGFSSSLENYACEVAGQVCVVVQADLNSILVEIPQISLENRSFGKLALDQNYTNSLINSTFNQSINQTQELPYIGGPGVKMEVYKNSLGKKTLDDWVAYFEEDPTLELMQTTTLLSLSYPEISEESNLIRVIKGYFHAPKDGTYRFASVVDDQLIMRMSTVKNNANTNNLVTLLKQQSYTTSQYNPYVRANESQQLTQNVTLTEGYYYFQLIVVNYGSSSFFKIMADMPEIYEKTVNPTWQVDQISIKPANLQPQIIVVDVEATSGSFDFYYLQKQGTRWVKYSMTVEVGTTAEEFKNGLSRLPNINSYKPEVTLETFDSSGNPTNNPSLIQKYKYSIIIERYRTLTDAPMIDNTKLDGEATVERTHNHSAPISGKFRLNIDGIYLKYGSSSSNFPYDVSVTYIENSIKQLYEVDEIEVRAVLDVSSKDQIRFVIQYLGIISPVPITIETFGLRGGLDNSMDAQYNILRKFSNRPLYSPIPSDFLYTASSKPSLLLKVNKIPAICDDCSYQFKPSIVPIVTRAVLNQNIYSLSLTDPENIGFALSDISVELLGVQCTELKGTIDSFECDFPQNQDGSASLPAGKEKPKIHIKQIGYADVGLLQQNKVYLGVDSLVPNTGAFGAQLSLEGFGFPIDEDTNFKITLCENNVTQFSSITNKRIVFKVPYQQNPCGQSEIVVNNVYSSIQFQYDHTFQPIIESLSVPSSSPILKKQLTILGANLGSISDTKVYLFQNGQQKYELSIVKMNDTQISCILGGGKTGSYDVVVFVQGVGLSSPSISSKFQYKIVVNRVSPSSGSMGGGYNITIQGQNFAQDVKSNNAFIGSQQNSICSVLESNSTHIVCEVPRISSDYHSGEVLDVVVTGRITEESICEGICSFTYDGSITSNITVPENLYYSWKDNVTIEGQGLAGAVVSVGGIFCQLLEANSTHIKFGYPQLPNDQYEIVIKTGTGKTHPQIITETNLTIIKVEWSSGSQMGRLMKISGNGFPEQKQDMNIWLICLQTQKLQIKELRPSQATVRLPQVDSDHDTCKVNVTIDRTYKLFSYTYRLDMTPQVEISHYSGLTYNLTKKSLQNAEINSVSFVFLDTELNPTSSSYSMLIQVVDSKHYQIKPQGGYLAAGTYIIQAYSDSYGFARIAQKIEVQFETTPSSRQVTASFVGGHQLTISGKGFVTNFIENNDIRVCGIKAQVKEANKDQITIFLPSLVTETTDQMYGLAVDEKVKGIPFGDDKQPENAFDSSTNTFYQSQNEECFVGVDFGEQVEVDISKIRYTANPHQSNPSESLNGGVFEGSNDNKSWTEIFEIYGESIHSGWNLWKKQAATYKYRYIRFSHTNQSRCSLAEIQIYGKKYSTIDVSQTLSKSCSILINNNFLISDTVVYDHSVTATIDSITPSFGSSLGGSHLILIGSNIGSQVSITIDEIPCIINAYNSTTINCTTGKRETIPATNTMIVQSDGNNVHLKTDFFLYIDKWTDEQTWGGQAIPRQGDSVYVPSGMTLLIDDSTPILDTFIIEGKAMFSDEKDMTLDAHYIVIKEGELEIGKEDLPYQHQLTITMHGSYQDKQLPIFGNKGIGCLNCKLNIHGKVRKPTFTIVKKTISPGDVSFQVIEPVDWMAGQSIAIASTSFDHFQAEEMVIKSVSSNGTLITVTTPFQYEHYAQIELYNDEEFPMRAEVGLLTRNIKIRGAQTDDKYGSHLLLHGKEEDGLIGRISYVQFSKCGQPKVLGRYCTHFHMAGQVPQSYVRGIAVHHSFARVLTIHGTHYLLVEKNVGYHVEGHNIFIQDGIQTHNTIQDNLMISSIASLTLLQSDVTVASYWITNPNNIVRRNYAAGSDFYGFWYEIKEHPDGPSATLDICPMGMRLGEAKDNYAHSNKRFGVRIFKLSARKFPCLPTRNESLIDPYEENEAIQSVFENFVLWRNEQCGFLGEELGFATIKNIKTADSKKGGLQFHKTNFTKQFVTVQNCLVVGYSQGNAPSDVNTTYENGRGVIASRTDGLRFTGIRFYNFEQSMTPLQSCSECHNMKVWVTGGKTTHFHNITYNSIKGNYIFWEQWRRQIFNDEDGSLTKPLQDTISQPFVFQQKAMITPSRKSLMIPGQCYEAGGDKWNNSIFCEETTKLRAILFANAIPSGSFDGSDIKVYLLADPQEDIDEKALEEYTIESQVVIKKSQDIKLSWAMPFATNNYYNIHWKWGIDFTHLAIAPSRQWTVSDAVVLRFNYTDVRELFQLAKWYEAELQLPYIIESEDLIDPETCQNGDYFVNNASQYLYVCVSGRNKQIHEWIDVNGLNCINFCPDDMVGLREDFQRNWTNSTQWPGQVLPKEGDNVEIPYEWNLLLDTDPPILNEVKIDGILTFDRTRNNTFQAHKIWVKQGIVKIGSESSPYMHNAKIVLHGKKDDKYMLLDEGISGNKMLAVTGGIQFYGNPPRTLWTQLTETAKRGSSEIKVANANDWKIGDQIVIAPSYSGRKEFQQVKITYIQGNIITFEPSLSFEHYGSTRTTISNEYGSFDGRSRVGHLTRNIKIEAGPDNGNWGCRLELFGYLDIPEDLRKADAVYYNGYAKLKGVQVKGCGQYDTEYAALRIERIGKEEENTVKTQITDSSIHNCGGFCTYIDKVSNISITNNVFFHAKKFIVYVQQVMSHYNFDKNLLIGALKRESVGSIVDDVAAYEQFTTILFSSDHQISVKNNLVQGSEGEGFVFPATPCKYLQKYPFVDNVAGSCEIGFMYETLDGEECLGASKMTAYASEIGLTANMPGTHTELIYDGGFFADNGRGITLRYAHEIDDNTCTLQNSYFTGFSRPSCPDCYGDDKISYCTNGYAVRMFTATISGQVFPLMKHAKVHDVICTRQSYDFKAFLNNVTFENYLYDNPQLPYCSKMSVFRRHPQASDGTGSHYLTNTTCKNCETKSWAYFEQPDAGWRGWFGGCGELDCTGPNNILIDDQDGTFMGEKGQLMSNNSIIGNNEDFCQFFEEMNGHQCKGNNFGVLEYESIARDFNQRVMWPVYLKYDGGNWKSQTNGWKEWQWEGQEPMNRRLARFWSIVKLSQNYNLTYSSTPPADSRFQIQKRKKPSGNSGDWVIIRIYYTLPNSIQVLVKDSKGKDQVVKPFPIREDTPENLQSHLGECGANNFHYQNGTIEFLVNGKDNCQVRVRLSSYIQLSVRISIPIDDFYKNDGQTTFINNICAFLGIDSSRLKIVGIAPGSTEVEAHIQAQATDLDEATTTGNDPEKEYDQMHQMESSLEKGLQNDKIYLGGSIVSYSTSVKIYNIDGTQYVRGNPTLTVDTLILIVTLSVVIPILAASLLLVAYCYWKHKRSKVETIVVEEVNESSVHAGITSDVNDLVSQNVKRRHIWRV